MFEDEEDELSEPIEPATRWCLLLSGLLGGFWGVFFVARRSYEYDLALQLLRLGYTITPVIAGLSFISGMIALHRLHKKGFARRGLAIVGVSVSSIALLTWLFFTLYINLIR